MWEDRTPARPGSSQDASGLTDGCESGGSDAGAAERTVESFDSLEEAEAAVRRLEHEKRALVQLLGLYRSQIEEVSTAALRLYPLAHSAVVTAGGTLDRPECLTRPLPELPD